MLGVFFVHTLRRIIPLVLLVALGVGARHAGALDIVDLELVIAVDVSASVDNSEYELQMRGISAAFRHPDVLAAVRAAGSLGVAVAVVQWSDQSEQRLAVDWSVVSDQRSAARLARTVRNTRRLIVGGQTAIGSMVRYALDLIRENQYEGLRKVIDVSGDGRANSGISPTRARENAIAEGITINGLAILNEEPFIDRYYERSVIGGMNAFVMRARNYEDFAAAIVEKLIQEIGAPLAAMPDGHEFALSLPGGASTRLR